MFIRAFEILFLNINSNKNTAIPIDKSIILSESLTKFDNDSTNLFIINSFQTKFTYYILTQSQN